MPIIQLKGNPEDVPNKNVTILFIMIQSALNISERSTRMNRVVLTCYCKIFLSLGSLFLFFMSDSAVMSHKSQKWD